MKVVKPKGPGVRAYTQRLPDDLYLMLEAERKRHDMKRNPFVEAILRQVLTDKSFVLKVGA